MSDCTTDHIIAALLRIAAAEEDLLRHAKERDAKADANRAEALAAHRVKEDEAGNALAEVRDTFERIAEAIERIEAEIKGRV
jgi:hypothetical protein